MNVVNDIVYSYGTSTQPIPSAQNNVYVGPNLGYTYFKNGITISTLNNCTM